MFLYLHTYCTGSRRSFSQPFIWSHGRGCSAIPQQQNVTKNMSPETRIYKPFLKIETGSSGQDILTVQQSCHSGIYRQTQGVIRCTYPITIQVYIYSTVKISFPVSEESSHQLYHLSSNTYISNSALSPLLALKISTHYRSIDYKTYHHNPTTHQTSLVLHPLSEKHELNQPN